MSSAEPMRSFPLWFKSGSINLFGWMDLPPDGTARAGVVVCPPIGRELLSAHDTLRILGEDLSSRGFAVLRFDYPGTGDSGDAPGPSDMVPLWSQSVSDAVTYLRASGLQSIALVGMRMGATMAALVAAVNAVDAVVLWDPCSTGKTFLRQQRALATLLQETIDPVPDPMLGEIPGYVYDGATASHISRLRLGDAPSRVADRTLLLLRQPTAASGVTAHFGGPGVTCEVASGQSELLDTSTVLSKIPISTVQRISQWLESAFTSESRPVVVSGAEAVVMDQERSITERFVRLGPSGLFGVRTDPPYSAALPTLLFLNSATEVHIGPARQWVVLARRLAALGFSSVRVDLSGLGDSPARGGAEPRRAYGVHLLEDAVDVVTDLSSARPANVVVIGLCSGAYAALETGASLGVRGVIAINPVLDPPRDLVMAPGGASRLDGDGRVRRGLARPRSRCGSTLIELAPLKRLVIRLPLSFWRMAHVMHAQRSPAEGFETVAESVADTLILCSPHDSRPFLERGRWIIDRLTRTGRFELRQVAVDHSLLGAAGREQVAQVMTSHLAERYGAPDRTAALSS